MGYRDSEWFGYTNGKLLWYANEGLFNLLSNEIFNYCNRDGCAYAKRNDSCEGCIAFKAEPILEKQVINEGIKYMNNLVKQWARANREKKVNHKEAK